MKTAIANVTGMRYDSAETNFHSGIKGRVLRGAFIKGERVIGGGRGSYVTAIPAHFILKVRIDDKDHEVWTERNFRDALGVGRLSPQAREIIKSTKPERVELEMRTGRGGTQYWVLSENALKEWTARIRSAR